MSGKLPTVPEEHANDYKPLGWSYYPELDLMPANSNGQVSTELYHDVFQ